MADIGDAVTIRTTITDIDGNLVDPATVTLEVTDPAGAITNPTDSNTGVGLYEATFTVDQYGRWLYRWITTSPEGIEWGELVVRPDPPARLLPLATTTDLEDILGRSLTAGELAKAPGLLHSASTKVRSFCQRQVFTRVDNDPAVLKPQGTTIWLPQRPVIDVTAVAAIAREGGADIPLAGWSYDGLEHVDLRQATDVANDFGSWWANIRQHVNVYRVTYSHGSDVVPPDPVDVTAHAVVRVLESCAPEGVTQRTLGQFSEQYQQSTGAQGKSPWLSKAEKEQLRDAGHRRRAGSIPVRRR